MQSKHYICTYIGHVIHTYVRVRTLLSTSNKAKTGITEKCEHSLLSIENIAPSGTVQQKLSL
jgi:hypothetical protein